MTAINQFSYHNCENYRKVLHISLIKFLLVYISLKVLKIHSREITLKPLKILGLCTKLYIIYVINL